MNLQRPVLRRSNYRTTSALVNLVYTIMIKYPTVFTSVDTSMFDAQMDALYAKYHDVIPTRTTVIPTSIRLEVIKSIVEGLVIICDHMGTRLDFAIMIEIFAADV